MAPSTSWTCGDGMTGNAVALTGSKHSNDKADAATNVRDDGRIVNDRFMVCPLGLNEMKRLRPTEDGRVDLHPELGQALRFAKKQDVLPCSSASSCVFDATGGSK